MFGKERVNGLSSQMAELFIQIASKQNKERTYITPKYANKKTRIIEVSKTAGCKVKAHSKIFLEMNNSKSSSLQKYTLQ